MSRKALTPGKALLFVVGAGAVALVGVPSLTPNGLRDGDLAGVVVDPHGAGVRGAQVALFHGRGLDLVELAETDGEGRFAFAGAPFDHHLYVRPPEGSGLVGTWALSLPAGVERNHRFALERGRSLEISVRDEEGRPVPGAEVRAYDTRHEAVVVVRTRTDDRGRVRIDVPELAHLAALEPGTDRLPAWRFDVLTVEDGTSLVLGLPAGRRADGRVTDPSDRPVEGAVASAWDSREDGWHWNGYARTDASGGFHLPLRSGAATLRVVDPEQRYLPAVVRVPEDERSLHVRLSEGELLDLSPDELPDGPARVWVWSDETGSWGWGARTDAPEAAAPRASPSHTLVVAPLD